MSPFSVIKITKADGSISKHLFTTTTGGFATSSTWRFSSSVVDIRVRGNAVTAITERESVYAVDLRYLAMSVNDGYTSYQSSVLNDILKGITDAGDSYEFVGVFD